MRTDRTAIRGNAMVAPHLDLEAIKEWVKRSFSNERIAGVTARVVVLGYTGAALYQVFQIY